MQIIKLNNGIDCPVIGLGTFMLSPKDAQNSTREALKMGYRLIDTANAYVNERAVGRGIRESFVARNEIFLSTKLWPSEYENMDAVDETLERLGVDYVDLLYIHQPAGNWLAGYRQLEKALKEGKARWNLNHIALSDYDGGLSFFLIQANSANADDIHSAVNMPATSGIRGSCIYSCYCHRNIHDRKQNAMQ